MPDLTHFGTALADADLGIVLLHGRGASAASMAPLAEALAAPGTAFVVPQAPGLTWYPYSFLAPLDANEPALSDALAAVAAAVDALRGAGLSDDRIGFVGFSQGACLALEYVARNARQWGGAAALSGGLIGNVQQEGARPDDKSFVYDGDLNGTPVFLGCSDVDAHIPLTRVTRSAEVLTALGGAVDAQIYAGMGHTINADEIARTRRLFQRP